MNAAVELRQVTKDYVIGLRGMRLRALDDLTFTILPGQIYGLLGPNGSGKSTTIKIILGLLEPTRGECRVGGILSRRVEARAKVGYMPEAPQFYRHLSGRELVTFYARMCGGAGKQLKARVDDVVEWVGLTAAAERRVGSYSKGMLQRIGLAQAIVHDPELVILDEPTAGVDPMGVEGMMKLILQLKAQGKTVLITSHLLAEMEEICDRVALLDRGRLLLEGAVSEVAPAGTREGICLDTLMPPEREELRSWMTMRGVEPTVMNEPGFRLHRVFVEGIRARNAAVSSEEH